VNAALSDELGKAHVVRTGREIFRSAHLTIWCNFGQRLVLVERTPEPFRHVVDIEAAAQGLSRGLPRDRRAGHSIISDFRAAPLRVRPELEPAFKRYREETESGFARAVVIASTPVGRARIDRLGGTTQLPIELVATVQEALSFVLRASLMPPPPR
jgi:hypothetical protein